MINIYVARWTKKDITRFFELVLKLEFFLVSLTLSLNLLICRKCTGYLHWRETSSVPSIHNYEHLKFRITPFFINSVKQKNILRLKTFITYYNSCDSTLCSGFIFFDFETVDERVVKFFEIWIVNYSCPFGCKLLKQTENDLLHFIYQLEAKKERCTIEPWFGSQAFDDQN